MNPQRFSFIWEGVGRTFDYWLPKGWIHFIEELYGSDPTRGLPVLIMLHGGTDSSAPAAGSQISVPNNCTVDYPRSGPSVATAGTTVIHIRRRAAAPVPLPAAIPFKGRPGVTYPWFGTANPEVWAMWDSDADHGSIADVNPQSIAAGTNPWPDVRFIWAWLRRHHKVVS